MRCELKGQIYITNIDNYFNPAFQSESGDEQVKSESQPQFRQVSSGPENE